jgi:hypothetical protein
MRRLKMMQAKCNTSPVVRRVTASMQKGGPISKELKTRPADLTALTKNNNGVFPYDRVYQMIDGLRRTNEMRMAGEDSHQPDIRISLSVLWPHCRISFRRDKKELPNKSFAVLHRDFNLKITFKITKSSS